MKDFEEENKPGVAKTTFYSIVGLSPQSEPLENVAPAEMAKTFAHLMAYAMLDRLSILRGRASRRYMVDKYFSRKLIFPDGDIDVGYSWAFIF